jgi:hypothetical protein
MTLMPRMDFTQLARALMEYETLDLAEVQKVIKGEPIRTVSQVLKEEKIVEEESRIGESATQVEVMGVVA